MQGRRTTYQESQLIREIAYIMSVHTGPFTRKFLVTELEKIHPDKDLRSLMIEVSSAIQLDKLCQKRFKVVKPGWWELS